MKSKSSERGLSTPAFTAVVLLIVVVVVIAAVMIGRSDGGEIDVTEVIKDSNQENIEKGGNPNDSVGTTPANLLNLPNGGLVPDDKQRGPSTPTEPVVEEAESGTTTEDGTEDEEIDDGSEEGEAIEEIPTEDQPDA